MSAYIFGLSLRQLVGRRSTLILAGLSLIPVLVAVVFRLSDPEVDPERWTVRVLLVGFIVTAALPLASLLMGTSVLGDELEDGTAVYLLTKPLARWRILLPKLLAAALATSAFVLTSTLVAGFIALEGQGDTSILFGFAIGILAGVLAYSSVFVLLSLVTSRAFIAGLVYVFIWEATMTAIFPGTRYFSIRLFSLGIADWIARIPADSLDVRLGGLLATILVVITTAGAILLANRRLQQIEIREAP